MSLQTAVIPLRAYQFSYLYIQFEQVGAKYCDFAPQAFLFICLFVYIHFSCSWAGLGRVITGVEPQERKPI